MKNITKVAGSLGLAAFAVLSIQPAIADDYGWHLGINIGRSMGNIDDKSIEAQLLPIGVTSVSIDDNDSDTAYKLFGGYRYNKNFAFEGGYFDLGQLGYNATTIPAGTLNGESSISGLNLDLVGSYPFSKGFSAFARLGINYTRTDDTFGGSGFVAIPVDTSPSENSTGFKFGVGLQYDLSDDLAMRFEVERYRVDDAIGNNGDIDMISLGLIYRFGAKKAYSTQYNAKPPVVKPSPPPAPMSMPIETQQYCSFLDIEFDIKQNEVHVEDREQLKTLATFMKKYPKTTAVIEGHTDNVGKSDYNLKLSRQRADSVVEYLVTEQAIKASRLSAVGYGETRPHSYNITSEGKQSNRRINAVIACVDDIAGLEVTPARVTMSMTLEFAPYDNKIDAKYYAALNIVANYLKTNPAVSAVVEGYADKFVGIDDKRTKIDTKTSMDIAQSRAQTVVNFLVDQLGIAQSRLNTVAYGQTDRVTYGATLDSQQDNRRVNIIFKYPS